jgi:hypothetical protein
MKKDKRTNNDLQNINIKPLKNRGWTQTVLRDTVGNIFSKSRKETCLMWKGWEYPLQFKNMDMFYVMQSRISSKNQESRHFLRDTVGNSFQKSRTWTRSTWYGWKYLLKIKKVDISYVMQFGISAKHQESRHMLWDTVGTIFYKSRKQTNYKYYILQ